ncbi:DinB family protein [Acidicapsa dinghuensis]|uniref:DinB family protein n=1 Tax=Acidicapsa dinghuensis TaxID=2218256 RepID=A0ABW1EHM7_9BACT|nr:DinB family protein [Acidicapsa dinghuensis]
MVAITGEELLKWGKHISDSWKQVLSEHPEALAFPCDIRETKTVAQLLQHIVAAELRYAERLNDLPQTQYDAIPFDSVEAIYKTHDRAMNLLRPLLDRDEAFWETVTDFQTRSVGTLHASRRTFFVHLLTHSIRHYAQLATLVRHQGIEHNWTADYLFMGLERPIA